MDLGSWKVVGFRKTKIIIVQSLHLFIAQLSQTFDLLIDALE